MSDDGDKDNTISLFDKTGDGAFWSPEQLLKDCLENDIGKQGAFKNGKKLLVIALDDNDNQYRVNWSQCGMKVSQLITLCEVAKATFLQEMNYIPTDDD